MSSNALATETWRGLLGVDRAQRAYLYCLVFQSLAVVVWWPGTGVMAAERTPTTLFVTLLAVGVSLSYQSIRMGAEELMLPGQQSMREWLISTRTSVPHLLFGYFVAHVLQTLHWLLLSAPIMLIAWSVGGSDWRVLACSLPAIFFLASVFRFAGAIVYLSIGQHGALTWYSLRLIVVFGYIAGLMLSPTTSYWHLINDLLTASYTGGQSILLIDFLLVYGICLMLLFGLFAALCKRVRALSMKHQ